MADGIVVEPLQEDIPETTYWGIDGRDGMMCLECGIPYYLGGLARFVELNDGISTDFSDTTGRLITMFHDHSWEFYADPARDYFPHGAKCVVCGEWCLEPPGEF